MCDIAVKYKSKCDNQEYYILLESYDTVNSEYSSILDAIANWCAGDLITLKTATQGNAESINEEAAELVGWFTACNGYGLSCLTENADLSSAVSKGNGPNPVALNVYTGPYYKLQFCESEEDALYFNSNVLDFYVGKVISLNLEGVEGKFCATVSKQDCLDGEEVQDIAVLSIIDYFSDCETCEYVPPVIPEETKVKQRTVKPGYDTPGCPPEYYDKTSCKFGEAQFQEVANRRFGIEFCCDPDQQKWEIKKELLDLAAAKDPDICETICPTPETVCNTVCLNIPDCFAGANEFGLFISNGDIAYSPILDWINTYETSNPDAYQSMLLFTECLRTVNYCLTTLCYYTETCYDIMQEEVKQIKAELQDCRQQITALEATQASEYDQQVVDLQNCISELQDLAEQLAKAQAELALAQQDLDNAIANGEPQNIIDELTAVRDKAQAEVDTIQQVIADTEENCGGNVTQLQALLLEIQVIRELSQESFEANNQWLMLIIDELAKINDQIENAETCCQIFPFICSGTTITFTGCSGNELTVPLGAINRKVYHKEGTTITFSSTSYGDSPASIVEPINPALTYNEIANLIFTWDEECDTPSCADDPTPPEGGGGA